MGIGIKFNVLILIENLQSNFYAIIHQEMPDQIHRESTIIWNQQIMIIPVNVYNLVLSHSRKCI